MSTDSVRAGGNKTYAAADTEALSETWKTFANADSALIGAGPWLALQCTVMPGARAGVVVLNQAPEPDDEQFSPVAIWPAASLPGRLLTEAADRALAEQTPLIVCTPASIAVSTVAVACPIRCGDRLYGVAAVEIAAATKESQEIALRQLQLGSAAIERLLSRGGALRDEKLGERLGVVLDAAALVLEKEHIEEATAALMTELAIRLSCDRVSLIKSRDGHGMLVAMSHTADFNSKVSLVRAIEAAADEAMDQRSTLCYPEAIQNNVLVVRDHANLAREYASQAILTVPFFGEAEFQCAVCFERAVEQEFDRDEVDLCEALVAFVGRIFELKLANELPLRHRIANITKKRLEDFLGPRYFGRKLMAAIAILLVLFCTLATGEYRVSGKATLEGKVRRVLAAPFDGYVGSAAARAGDVVAAGSTLAALDDRDLRLERLRWASQHAQFSRQFEEAAAKHDRGQALIFQAQMQQAEAQIVLTEEQLTRAVLVAPFDGLVASGDLSQSIGSTVRKGQVLFEITPLDGYRVIIDIDESEVTDLHPEQKGWLVLSSIADESLPLTVKVVTPVTAIRDGSNTFRVEAILERHNERLRPGMEGIAKIVVDERRLVWIWTHRLVNWLRLATWTWLP